MFIESEEALSLVEFVASDNRISISTRGQGDRNNPVVLFATVVELLGKFFFSEFSKTCATLFGPRQNFACFFSHEKKIDALLENQFKVKAKILLPCPSCVSSQVQKPTLFTKEECESIAAKKEMTVRYNFSRPKIPSHFVRVFFYFFFSDGFLRVLNVGAKWNPTILTIFRCT